MRQWKQNLNISERKYPVLIIKFINLSKIEFIYFFIKYSRSVIILFILFLVNFYLWPLIFFKREKMIKSLPDSSIGVRIMLGLWSFLSSTVTETSQYERSGSAPWSRASTVNITLNFLNLKLEQIRTRLLKKRDVFILTLKMNYLMLYSGLRYSNERVFLRLG